ncbi:hypothetical protein ACFY8O_17090 [Streptomyces argenteolus]|uniref:Uncharacterized protein n=1 Tax=Streptomyces argenteolus TaxID=67274 RepID=A0ABW6X6D5_9ACTN
MFENGGYGEDGIFGGRKWGTGDEVMMLSEEQWEALDPQKYIGYGVREIPCVEDAHVDAAIRAITSSADMEVIVRFTRRSAWRVFNAFAVRMASLGVRNRDPEIIRRGLVACGVALSSAEDFREVILSLTVLHRASILIEEDPVHLFREASGVMPPWIAEIVDQFPMREVKDLRIEPCGYAEGRDGSGFRFVSTW